MRSETLSPKPLRTIILKLLRIHGRLYAFEISIHIKALSLGKIKLADDAIYPILNNMESDGLICCEVVSEGNSFLNLYKPTAKGTVASKAKNAKFENFMSTMFGILDAETKCLLKNKSDIFTLGED